MTKYNRDLVYRVVVSVNGEDQFDHISNQLYKKHSGLKLGRTGMKSAIVKDEAGNKMQSRRVHTGLYY